MATLTPHSLGVSQLTPLSFNPREAVLYPSLVHLSPLLTALTVLFSFHLESLSHHVLILSLVPHCCPNHLPPCPLSFIIYWEPWWLFIVLPWLFPGISVWLPIHVKRNEWRSRVPPYCFLVNKSVQRLTMLLAMCSLPHIYKYIHLYNHWLVSMSMQWTMSLVR